MADEHVPNQQPAPASGTPAGQAGFRQQTGSGGARPQGGRPGAPPRRGKRSFVRKRKVCRFCVDKSDFIDYKKAEILAPFLQERWLTVAIKRAQNIALLPFSADL